MSRRCQIVVLISGSGSNLQAIIEAVRDGRIDADVRAVVSNRQAFGLERAAQAGLPAELLQPARGEPRGDYDRRLLELTERYRPDLLVLAGFMRILSAGFVEHYAGRMLNIHPSLLPAYKGLDTHARVLADGCTQHGATVHFVTAELDSGPALIQGIVNVAPRDTVETLSARVHRAEHIIYPKALEWFAAGRTRCTARGLVFDGEPLGEPKRMLIDA
ncbi:MAG: phosphoribosylglycinamide formyltransferase [Pseudomonadota bacterium]